MAHPHAEHRQHKVERRRVAHITKGYASDEAADVKFKAAPATTTFYVDPQPVLS